MPNPTCKIEPLIANKLLQVVPLFHNEQRKKTRAVIFVHGFIGDAVNTWKHKDAEESFASMLASDPRLADHDFFLFQYVTKDVNPPAIDNIVLQLKFVINEKLQGSRIVFVAHSMGGLVAMGCILKLLEENQPHAICGLLLYGSPIAGVEWARYAEIVLKLTTLKFPLAGFISRYLKTNKQIKALTTGSEFIDRLNGNWALRVLNGGHPKVVATQRAWFPVRVVSGNDDWVVKESSARGFYSDIDWINVDQDHTSLVKPRDRSDFVYQIAAGFLDHCRRWVNPHALLKLRTQLDSMWSLHQHKAISNWRFEVSFDREPDASGSFGLPNFRPFRVVECSYRRLIGSKVLKFGMAVGPIAASALWSDDFVYLNSIFFGALSQADSEPLVEQLRNAINVGAQNSGRLVDALSVRVQHPDGTWHGLVLSKIETPPDGLVWSFELPQDLYWLIGEEAVVDVSFRSVLPVAINDYAIEFPWLCDGFVMRATVKGSPSFLSSNQAMRGSATIHNRREHLGKVEFSSNDLILPGSSLQFEWGFEGK